MKWKKRWCQGYLFSMPFVQDRCHDSAKPYAALQLIFAALLTFKICKCCYIFRIKLKKKLNIFYVRKDQLIKKWPNMTIVFFSNMALEQKILATPGAKHSRLFFFKIVANGQIYSPQLWRTWKYCWASLF